MELPSLARRQRTAGGETPAPQQPFVHSQMRRTRPPSVRRAEIANQPDRRHRIEMAWPVDNVGGDTRTGKQALSVRAPLRAPLAPAANPQSSASKQGVAPRPTASTSR